MSKSLPKNKPLLLGITGGIGSGKSSVAEIFKVHDVPVFNSDTAAKGLMNSDTDVQKGIISLFGSKAFEDGTLNRRFLAEKIFGDSSLRKKLNGLVHPAVSDSFIKWVAQHQEQHLLVREAAIMIETGSYTDLDAIILVVAPEDLRIKRIMARDKISRQDAHARIAAQWTDAAREPFVDFVVVNDGIKAMIPQVLGIISKFTKEN